MRLTNNKFILNLLTIAVGIFISVSIFLFIRTRELRNIQEKFFQSALIRANIIESEIENSFEALQSLQSLYQIYPNTTREDLQKFIAPILKRNSTIQALKWIKWSDYKSGKNITELLPHVLLQPTFKIDITKALSIIPVQNSQKSFELLAFSPLYLEQQKAFGLVFGAFAFERIVIKSLSKIAPSDINFCIVDISDPKRKQILYKYVPRKDTVHSNNNPLFTVHKVKIADRSWQIKCSGSFQYIEQRRSWHSWGFLFISLLCTSFLSACLMIFSQRLLEKQFMQGLSKEISERKQAQEKHKEIAKALHKQTKTLKSIVENMREGLVVADENGEFVIFNPSAKKIVGLGATGTPLEEWSNTYKIFCPDTLQPYPSEKITACKSNKR